MNTKRLTVSSNFFIWAAAVYFGSVLNLSFYRFILEKNNFHTWSDFIFGLSLPIFVIVPLLIFFSLITVPRIEKIITGILLFFSAAANYAMFNLGIIIDREMFRNILETNFREAADMITPTAVVWIIITGVLPFLFLLHCKIIYLPLKKEIIRRLKYVFAALTLFCCLTPMTYKSYVSFARNNSQIRKQFNTFNYIYAITRHYQRQATVNRDFTIIDDAPLHKSVSASTPKVLVLIIGETARAANFSLYGYERKTNPLLEQQNIITFNDTFSCGTSTAISLPCMFSHLPRHNFNSDKAAYMENLTDIIQKAGFKVLWHENDDGCKGICARVPTEDTKESTNEKFCSKDFCYDEILLDGLKAKLSEINTDTVIILHTIGSHGPAYYKRYPDKFRHFTPDCNTADLQNCSRSEIINAYDNTVLYTDFIVSSAIDMLKNFPQYVSSLIYISDHGESLGENNFYLHGLPYRFAPEEQKKVPFILWLSEKTNQSLLKDTSCLRHRAKDGGFSHDNLFHSVLGLLEIESAVYDQSYDIFTSCRK